MKKIDQMRFNKEIGLIIRKLREEKQLSRHTLANISDVNEKYIGKIERGECSASAFILKKISFALEIQLSTLLKEF